jgi:23S rRNA (guanine2445-N2)-methyltransferase / 23S rRNA (guanine2069-N7)-methyltransferase
VQGRREVFEEINEQGCRLLVNLTDYLDTGVFLNHRLVRARIRELAADKDFLNLFAYTCSASVYAAAGGARSTTSIDMSKTYLDWGQRNMKLNGFNKPCHQFVRDDVMAWLKAQQGNKARQYDLIFIDPPTFSNSKRTERDFDVQRDHVRMLRLVSKLLRDDGLIIFSNNFRRFKLDPVIEEKYVVRDISRGSIPEDFARHSRIHQCWELRRR